MTQTNTTDISDIVKDFGLSGFDTPNIDLTLNSAVEEYVPQSKVGQRFVEGAGLALTALVVGYLGTALIAGVPTETHAAEPAQTDVDIPWHNAYASKSRDASILPVPGQHYLLEFDGNDFAVSVDPTLSGLHIDDSFVSFDRGTNCEVGHDANYCVGSLTYNPNTNVLGFTAYKTKSLDEIQSAAVVDTLFDGVL